MISGGQRQFIPRSAAQVNGTGGAWVQVISPASNTNGIYVSHLLFNDGTDAKWRAHTALPTSTADGVDLGKPSTTFPRIEVNAIIPAGQGIYAAPNGGYSTIYYQVL